MDWVGYDIEEEHSRHLPSDPWDTVHGSVTTSYTGIAELEPGVVILTYDKRGGRGRTGDVQNMYEVTLPNYVHLNENIWEASDVLNENQMEYLMTLISAQKNEPEVWEELYLALATNLPDAVEAIKDAKIGHGCAASCSLQKSIVVPPGKLQDWHRGCNGCFYYTHGGS